jgi:hypothetical protein
LFVDVLFFLIGLDFILILFPKFIILPY